MGTKNRQRDEVESGVRRPAGGAHAAFQGIALSPKEEKV
jgi:hypothetical protein